MTLRTARAWTIAAVVLGAAAPGCGGDDDRTAPPERLRQGPTDVLLQRVALEGSYCVLTPVAEEGEGELDGNQGFASQAYFEARAGQPNGNNLSVSIDRFASARRARAAATAAGADLAALVGSDPTDEGTLAGRDGSVVHAMTVTDFQGQPRGTFAAAVPIAAAVVRVSSFGVSTIPDVSTFDTVAERVIEGLIGDAPLAPVPACGT
jgi:hypothetical protein